jgi:hypothetical protein
VRTSTHSNGFCITRVCISLSLSSSAGVAWRLDVCVVFEAFLVVWRRQLSLCGVPPQGVVFKSPLISEWVV